MTVFYRQFKKTWWYGRFTDWFPFKLFHYLTVRMSGESGKVDILLTKEAAGVQWTELGQGLQGNNSFKPHKERGIKNSEKAHIYLLYARITENMPRYYTVGEWKDMDGKRELKNRHADGLNVFFFLSKGINFSATDFFCRP